MAIMLLRAFLAIFIIYLTVYLTKCSIDDKIDYLGNISFILESYINNSRILPLSADLVTGCYGILFCYISQLSSLNKINWKPTKAFRFTKKGEYCQNAYNAIKHKYPSLKNKIWHGILVNKQGQNTLEIQADIFPKGENLFIKGITPSELFNFLLGNDASLSIKKKIFNASKIDENWLNSSLKLKKLLEEYTGILALKYDIMAKRDKNIQSKPSDRVFFWAWVNKYPINKKFIINYKNAYIPYHLDNVNPTCSNSTKLLILIMSRITGFNNRDGIRRTWLKDAVAETVTKFLISDSLFKFENFENKEAIEKLEELIKRNKQLQYEQMENKDLIFLHGFEDIYANLHFKWLAALQWQQAFCPQTKFLMKTDDDTIVHLPRLNHWIDKKFIKEIEKNLAIYFGWIISGAGPIRDPKHKWYVSENVYPNKRYPNYMQGATYVASSAAINAIMPYTTKVDGFNMDDILFTGILADLANVTKSNHREMFRVGNKLDKEEKCEDKVPYVTALYGASNFENFQNIYNKLKNVTCP